MRQLAKKWDTSISFLSQIKNKKRNANLDLAIKIMQELDVPTTEKAYYCRLIQNRKSKNIEVIDEEIKSLEKKKLLSDKFSKILEGESYSLDIFLDISLAESEGVPLGYIFRNYGNQGIRIADLLAETELVSKKGNTYFIDDENCHFTPSKEALFGIINKVNERLNTRVSTDSFEGGFNLEIHDISEVGLEKLKVLLDRQIEEVQTVIENHKKEAKHGGVRVSYSHVLGKIMEKANTVMMSLLIFIFTISISLPTVAGGISGGYKGYEWEDFSKDSFSDLLKIINEKRVFEQMNKGASVLPELKLKLRSGNEFDHNRLQVNWVRSPFEFNNDKYGFNSKAEALNFLKQTMNHSKKGMFESRLIPRIKNKCQHESNMSGMKNRARFSLTHALLREGLVYKTSMKIEEYLNLSFEFRYRVKVILHIPCKVNY